MAVLGLGAVWLGGLVFGALVALTAGLIIWEITRMLTPERGMFQVAMGAGGAGVVLIGGFVPTIAELALILSAVTAGAIMFGRDKGGEPGARRRFAVYTGWILLAGFGLTALRDTGGISMILWLVAVVVATDIAGYFVGKTLGGPKFWPRVSPKKTWSGTIAGWVAAGFVGLAFGGPVLALLSMLLSFASQMGDAAESALKRHTGIKDSSNLIPGHGGAFDRFDALMGAALVLTIAFLAGWPGLFYG